MILSINTASSTTEIAFTQNGNTIAHQSWPSHNDEASRLLPTLKAMLKSSDQYFADISQVIAVRGPGSFTGLRIGITVANTISHLLKIHLKSLTTFQYWWALKDSNFPEKAALLIFAGKQGVYLSTSPNEDGSLHSLDDALEKLQELNIEHIFGDITPEQQLFFSSFTYHPITSNLPQALQNIENFLSETIITPLYIKPPGITEPKSL